MTEDLEVAYRQAMEIYKVRLSRYEALLQQLLVEVESMDPHDCEHELNEMKMILEMALPEVPE